VLKGGSEVVTLGADTVGLATTQRGLFFQEGANQNDSSQITVLYGPDVYPLHEPGEGWQTIKRFPWHLTLDALDALISETA
jgi:hypothetical protein